MSVRQPVMKRPKGSFTANAIKKNAKINYAGIIKSFPAIKSGIP